MPRQLVSPFTRILTLQQLSVANTAMGQAAARWPLPRAARRHERAAGPKFTPAPKKGKESASARVKRVSGLSPMAILGIVVLVAGLLLVFLATRRH